MDAPEQPTVPPRPELVVPTVVRESRPGPAARPRRALGCLAIVLGLGLAMSLLVNLALVSSGEAILHSDTSVKEKYHSLNRHGKNKVAIVEVSGTIVDGENTKKIFDAIKKDQHVKAVVLRVDSPGGTVSGSDYVYHHLEQLVQQRELPLVVSMGGVAASGGYYISMAVGHTPDTIFAEPSTWTGSIGVIIPHYDLSGFLAEHKISEDSVKSSPLKAIGSFTKPMTEEERKILQGLVDDGFRRFEEIVKSGRKRFADDPDALKEVATGQVFTAGDAKQKGLVDRIGYLEDAIDRAIELAGIDKDSAKAVKYTRQLGLMEQLFLGPDSTSPGFSLAKALELTSPRAYYLWTWLPALESLSRP
jgi:protease-4